jgi:predicted AlkP superfamily phosphohydrolase/phosphomutase
MSLPARPKVVMIGLDALDIDLVQASLDDLPTLRGLFERGALHRLDSPAAHLTSAVWPTFATGLPPGAHGVYYPMQWDPRAMELRRVAADWIDFEPFWYGLGREGLRTTALDVPFSLPSRLENGVELINWGSQECLGPVQANRPDVARAVLARFGRHPMGEEIPVAPTAERLQRLRRALVDGARRKAEVAKHLMRETDWDLFVTVFAEPHRGGHSLWALDGPLGALVPQGALLEVYRAVDAAVGELLATIDRQTTTAVVFSVHGMGPGFTQEHFAQTLVDRLNARFHGASFGQDEAAETGASPIRMLRAMVPGQVQYLLARALPTAVRDWVVRRSFTGGIDWARTPGFALPCSGESYVRLALRGRERDGAFDADGPEIARYRASLHDDLLALREVGSEAPVVREVVDLRRVFPGPRADLLPDQVLLWERCLPATAIHSAALGRIDGRLTTGRTGDHRPDGFAIVHGPRQGLVEDEAPREVADLARTARLLLGRTDPA